jgi:hypothetical protein
MASIVNRQSADLKIEMEKGSTFRHKLTWKAGAEGAETPVDLTDATSKMQIRPSISSNTVNLELNTENGGITLGGALGTIHLYVSDTDTTAFTFKKAVYSLEVTLGNGDVRTLVRGNIAAYDEVTR